MHVIMSLVGSALASCSASDTEASPEPLTTSDTSWSHSDWRMEAVNSAFCCADSAASAGRTSMATSEGRRSDSLSSTFPSLRPSLRVDPPSRANMADLQARWDASESRRASNLIKREPAASLNTQHTVYFSCLEYTHTPVKLTHLKVSRLNQLSLDLINWLLIYF